MGRTYAWLAVIIVLLVTAHVDDVRDDAFLAHVETLGEQLRMGRELYPDEIDPKDFVLSRTGSVRGNFLRTLVNAINLCNEAGVGGTPLADMVRA